jgi:replicative DNA helicase
LLDEATDPKILATDAHARPRHRRGRGHWVHQRLTPSALPRCRRPQGFQEMQPCATTGQPGSCPARTTAQHVRLFSAYPALHRTAIGPLQQVGQQPGRQRRRDGVPQEVHLIHGRSRAIIVREALKPVIQKLDDHHRGHKLLTGLPTGFNYVDNMLCGLNEAEVTLIGGRPGLGKTSLVLGMGMNIAKTGVPVAVFSLEMTVESLMTRMLFMEARASLHKFRNGFLMERDAARLMEAPKVFKDMPMHIDDTAGLNIQQLSARARRLYRKQGVRLFIVDYMQLIKPTRRYNNREQEVAEVSSGLLALAKELRVPMLVCVQLNRESAKMNREPELTDFRDSGQVEQDCHVAGILWKPEVDEDDPKETAFVERAEWLDRSSPWQEQMDLVNLKFCKNRNGPTGNCGLVYYKQWTRFADAYRPTGVNKPVKKQEEEEL